MSVRAAEQKARASTAPTIANIDVRAALDRLAERIAGTDPDACASKRDRDRAIETRRQLNEAAHGLFNQTTNVLPPLVAKGSQLVAEIASLDERAQSLAREAASIDLASIDDHVLRSLGERRLAAIANDQQELASRREWLAGRALEADQRVKDATEHLQRLVAEVREEMSDASA